MKRAVVVGGSGLVGGHLIAQLLADPAYSHVVSLGRRELPGLTHPKLEQRVIDFDRLDATIGAFQADAVFCCLGTTIRAAGSREAFRKVDYTYPLEVAKLARQVGVTQFLLVTAIGASSTSPSFYLRTKGELERDVGRLGFPNLQIFRPSFLLGARAEARPLENVAMPIFRILAPVMIGPLRAFRPIDASEVARQMVEGEKIEGSR